MIIVDLPVQGGPSAAPWTVLRRRTPLGVAGQRRLVLGDAGITLAIIALHLALVVWRASTF